MLKGSTLEKTIVSKPHGKLHLSPLRRGAGFRGSVVSHILIQGIFVRRVSGCNEGVSMALVVMSFRAFISGSYIRYFD